MTDIENVQRSVPTKKVGKSVGVAVLDPRTKKITVEPEGDGKWTVVVLRSR
jgi:hypothetical protein